MTSRRGQTPSQTVGPYFSMRLAGPGQNVLAGEDVPGERIRVEGRVLDGHRHHVEDALIELWQADASGHYRHPDDVWPGDGSFTGFGRAASAFDTGVWWFDTIKPGRIPGPGGRLQAPHLSLVVQARGMLNPVFTRLYFADEQAANAEDPVLAAVPEGRRSTLIARQPAHGDGRTYEFDVVFQGDDETVFFDV